MSIGFVFIDCILHSRVDGKTGVNKKPKKFKTVWHGVRGIFKLSGRVNQARLKLSAGFLILFVGLIKRVLVLQIA